MSRSDDHRDIADPATTTCLPHGPDCCGCHDSCVLATTAIGTDGLTSMWLITRNAPADERGWYVPPHEDVGRLPRGIWFRIHHSATCEAPTRAGRPCSRSVAEHGLSCHQHDPARTQQRRRP